MTDFPKSGIYFAYLFNIPREFSMKKSLLIAVFLTAILGFKASDARAVILTFEASNMVHTSFDDAVLFLYHTPYYGSPVIETRFEATDMTFRLNTRTGNALVYGTITDITGPHSDEWQMLAVLTDIYVTVEPLPGDVPYDEMLDDLKTAGTADADTFIRWGVGGVEGIFLRTEVDDPDYDGATRLTWKDATDYAPHTDNSTALAWNMWDGHDGTLDDYFGFTGWMTDFTRGIGLTQGDLNFTFYEETAATIPEPATMVLTGIGLGGIGILRKRKKHKYFS
jgi:hypothetical protein